ncbi:YchJ family protein [soil metagenome]
MTECSCGSGFADAECCAPILAGERRAVTAAALMRSRYTAYVRSEVDYLISTHDPAKRSGLERAEILKFTKSTTWLGLEIVATEAGGQTDRTGMVEFIARGSSRGKPFTQHERSRFRRDSDGNWIYVDGELRELC